MGSRYFEKALESLGSDNSRERPKGLEEVERLLQNIKGTPQLKGLKDEGFHNVFEALFRFVRVEKASYLRASTSKAASAPSARLSRGASALRLAIEVSNERIKSKTVNAVLDHLVDSLPAQGQVFCEPIAQSYLKSIRLVLEYPTHTEHLRGIKWLDLVDFILHCLDEIAETYEGTQSASSFGTPQPDAPSSNRRQQSLVLGSRQSASSSLPSRQSYAEELIHSLVALVNHGNHPILSRAEVLGQSMLDILQNHAMSSAIHHGAFRVLNKLLCVLGTEDLKLFSHLVSSCLREIRRLWGTRFAPLREEMAVALCYVQDLMQSKNIELHGPDLHQSLADLFDVLGDEYTSRQEKDLMRVEDILFHTPSAVLDLDGSTFGPSLDISGALANWTLLSSLAAVLMHTSDQQVRQSRTSPDADQPSKRRRIESPMDHNFDHALSGTSSQKIFALQLITFVLPRSEAAVLRCKELAGALLDAASADSGEIASWTFLACSRLASTSRAREADFVGFWDQAGQKAVRSISVTPVSQSACHLLDLMIRNRLVPRHRLSALIDSIFGGGSGGPSFVSDSALSLSTALMQANVGDGISLRESRRDKVFAWITRTWNLSSPTDRVTIARLSTYGQAAMVSNALLACSNRYSGFTSIEAPPLSTPLILCLYTRARDRKLREYLMNHDKSPLDHIEKPLQSKSEADELGRASDRLVIKLLVQKVKDSKDIFKAALSQRASNVTQGLLSAVFSVCLAAYLVGNFLPASSGAVGLLDVSDELWNKVCEFLSTQDAESSNMARETLTSALWSIGGRGEQEQMALHRAMARCLSLGKDILSYTASHSDLSVDDAPDALMDEFEDSMTSNRGHAGEQSPLRDVTRLDVPFSSSTSARISRMWLDLRLQYSHHLDTEDNAQIYESQAIFDMLLDTNPADMFGSRSTITQVLRGCTAITRSQGQMLVQKLAESCLQEYALERNEAALCLCLDVMETLVNLWAIDVDDDLFDIAYDMYSWFLEIGLGKGIASDRVLIRVAHVLGKVMEVNAGFARDESEPSPRTHLLTLLQSGNNIVRFYSTPTILDLFGHFVLDQHDKIFNDVIEHLPTDPQYLAGIALRLYVLTELACRWRTLLRRSIYHLFETPALIPACSEHAHACIRRTCHTLDIERPQRLFQLFAPQILYTWLQDQAIDSIPYRIFEYQRLQELLVDICDEVVAQSVMREDKSNLAQIARHLSSRADELIRTSFGKVEAYCIARDIGVPRSQSGGNRSVESGLKKQFGASAFGELIQSNFPTIVATLLLSMDVEDEFEKAVSRHQGSQQAQYASQVLRALGKFSQTVVTSQQPAFRAKYILDELSFVCQRADIDMETMWSPALLTYVARQLFNAALPALGSFHACGMLRRLRMVLSLAGPTALSGYPLEMLLHGIRPFFADFHCSEDAISICQYLLSDGKTYLQGVSEFFGGYAMTSFATLLQFLDAKQDSTTQESQFKATLSKAQGFHEWLSEYVDTYRPSQMTSTLVEPYRKLLHSSSKIHLRGIANRECHEGIVMMGLLQNLRHKEKTVSISATDATFKLLSDRIQMAENINDDILGTEEDAIAYAPFLLHLLRRQDPSASFRKWAARVMGRAYAASGEVCYARVERHLDPQGRLSVLEAPLSGKFILKTLCSLLSSEDLDERGSAEHTVQMIVSTLHGRDDPQLAEAGFDAALLDASVWEPYICPPLPLTPPMKLSDRLTDPDTWAADQDVETWASKVSVALCFATPNNPILASLPYILARNQRLAEKLFPAIVHLGLEGAKDSREDLSQVFGEILQANDEAVIPVSRLMLQTITYLRQQTITGESTIADREKWLDIDFGVAAKAAAISQMYETSLLFLEIEVSRTTRSSRSRRSSVSHLDEQLRAMHNLYENLEDPDSFYGVPREPSLESIMTKLDFESNGFNSLSFQSATFDARMRMTGIDEDQDASGLLRSLNEANLEGLAYNICTKQTSQAKSTPMIHRIALDLRQWDIQTASENGDSSSAFKVLQHANQVEKFSSMLNKLDAALLASLTRVLATDNPKRLRTDVADLAALTELGEIFSRRNFDEMTELWERLERRADWMGVQSIDRARPILATREAAFASVSRKPYLAEALNLSSTQALLHEVKAVRQTLGVARNHDELQLALNSAAYLSVLNKHSPNGSIDITGAAQLDLASVLWKHGETGASIQILRDLSNRDDLQKQIIPVSRLEILAEIGNHVAEARLEKPEDIQTKYLLTAIKEVKSSPNSTITGRVYHEFASFCDKQLQNPDDLDDFNRIEKLRTRKEKEVQDLEKMMTQADGKQRDALKVHRTKAKQWFELDNREYERLKKIREGFLEKCLSNYLLALKACPDFDNDVLRFVALWLDQSGSAIANKAVEENIKHVPSRKFAPLMNQLSSRLLDEKDDPFQRVLFDLIVRICSDHPYHGMYQIFASSKSKGGRDELALSRHAAANRVTDRLRQDRASGTIWVALHNASVSFVRFAIDRFDDSKLRSGSKISLNKIPTGNRMEQEVTSATTKIPTPTMKIPLRADCDYNDVPRLIRFEPQVSIAGGVSAPKIVTTVASDGSRHKQLFKGGNDDLRQDAIMEQVFEQVSNLLRDHRATRQRNLGIRTYKVLPLTANAGIIEFVPNTIPLHDYLLPAHQKHFPKDYKPNQCRKLIADAQARSVETRVATFKKVTDHFQPVMRYFFLERFMDPIDWYQKRLSYSRSTAAISILGHVLGLGDRHGHNILLDEQTGEVVHIDLGVAFEAGRVLPVPEVVPFRLTRDLVDGMGITGVEGVFRRCCNFTLEALRQDSYSIMTILDVLRYDPLYSWSVSPLRLKKMQDSQQAEAGNAAPQAATATGTVAATGTVGGGGRRAINEPSEADRALTVVAKKLGKSLSVEATVNELIQAATDERNLAVLYCGWAAYA